jgi:hypothetical protein
VRAAADAVREDSGGDDVAGNGTAAGSVRADGEDEVGAGDEDDGSGEEEDGACPGKGTPKRLIFRLICLIFPPNLPNFPPNCNLVFFSL